MPKKYLEFRGVSDLVAAEVLTDDKNAYEVGEVFDIAGVATLTRETENSSEAHYYDNLPVIVIASEGATTTTVSVSVVPLDDIARLTGQTYDSATGALIQGNRKQKYFAVGYKTQDNEGHDRYVWNYKCMFSIPSETHNTQNNSTDANGQELVMTGIATTHKWTKTNESAKSLVVDTSLGLADVSTFFDTVTTPDALQPITPPEPVYYTVTFAPNAFCTVDIDPVTVLAGSSIQLPTDGITPESGNVFKNWALDNMGVRRIESPFKPAADVTIYAICEPEVGGGGV